MVVLCILVKLMLEISNTNRAMKFLSRHHAIIQCSINLLLWSVSSLSHFSSTRGRVSPSISQIMSDRVRPIYTIFDSSHEYTYFTYSETKNEPCRRPITKQKTNNKPQQTHNFIHNTQSPEDLIKQPYNDEHPLAPSENPTNTNKPNRLEMALSG